MQDEECSVNTMKRIMYTVIIISKVIVKNNSELVRTKVCHFSKIKMHAVKVFNPANTTKGKKLQVVWKVNCTKFPLLPHFEVLETHFKCFETLITLFKTRLNPLCLKFLRIQDWQSRKEYQGLSFEELSIYLWAVPYNPVLR